jgi:hypothetical protein
MFIGEVKTAAAPGAPQPFPKFQITTFPDGQATLVLVGTSPMEADPLLSVYSLLEGPDLVGMRGGNTSLIASVTALLAQNAKMGGKQDRASQGASASGSGLRHLVKGGRLASAAGTDLVEMSVVWLKWGGGKDTDPEAEFLRLYENDQIAKALNDQLVARSHTGPEEMEWRVSTLRFASVQGAESVCSLLVGLGYNCTLRQSRSFGGSNPFTRSVTLSQKAVAAAGGPEQAAALLKEHLEEFDPLVVVVPQGATDTGPQRFMTKFSNLGGLDKARGKVPIFLDMVPIGDIRIQAQPLITRSGQIAIDTDGPADSGNVDLDLHAIQSPVNALASARRARAEAWELRDGGFCFRSIPCSVGVELARRGFLVVNGQKFRLTLSYAANSAVSMGPSEKRPFAKALLEDWLVRCPQQCQLKHDKKHASSCCTSSHVTGSLEKVVLSASVLSSHRPSHPCTLLPNLSVHHMWRASVLGMLQILSHILWSLTLRRVSCDKVALLEMVDAFLTPRQPQPNLWPARPFLGRTSTKMPAPALSSNVSFHVLAGVELSQVSTTRWARKDHLIRTAELKPVSKGTLDLEGRPPLYVSYGETHSSHGDQMHFGLHYPGASQVNVPTIPNCNDHTPLVCPCTMHARNVTIAFMKRISMHFRVYNSSFHSSNIILNFNRALDMYVITSIRTALLLALSVSIFALLSCRQLAQYFMMMSLKVSKLPRPCRLQRNRCLRHSARRELRNSRHKLHMVTCIIYLIIYYIMLENSFGRSTLQPCSWVVNNVR